MFVRTQRPSSAPPTDRRDRRGWLRHFTRVGVTAMAGLTVAAPGTAAAVDLIDSGATALASDDPAMESVLVATRRGEPLGDADAPTLEPISQVSDHEPELADPADYEPKPQARGETLGPAEPRVAALPADGSAALSDVASAYREATAPRPAKFHGVTPGVSTRAELVAAWGEPDRAAKAEGDTLGGEVLGYDLKPFKQVEALIEDDSVGVVRVTLDKQPTVAELARRLRLQDIEPVDVSDDRTGSLLAVAFPEKGLTLLVDSERYDAAAAATSDAAVVTHLVLEPIDARAFTLRAERRSGADVGAAIADLDRALALTPNEPHTLWLSSMANLSVGQAAAAADAAGRAVDLDETDATARVAWAEALLATGEFDQAVFQTRRVLDDEQTPEVARAQALGLMGRLAALGDAKIARKAIDFQNAAIEIADRLATSEDTRERRLAKDLLVDCHLAIAREVAGRDYNDKASTVAEWIGRASGLAEDRIETDGGGLELRLRVARGALAALAEMRPTKDPAPWIAEAQEAADTLLDEATDPLFRARVHWELGEAYQHAVRIEHTRGEADRALGYGTRAIDELSAGAEPRTTSIDAERLVGTLYFYLGAVNAVHNGDHQEAVGWYDKGRPILTADRTPSDLLVPRRGGEALVSMGVSYWNLDQRELAVELTESGARLMERGVSAGVLGESALAVPYGNLATMLGKLGENDRAAEYRRLAKGVAPAKTPADDATASAKPQRSAATGRQTRPTGGPTAEQSAQTAAPSQRRTPERVAGAQPTNQRATDQASTGSPSGSGRAISRRRIGGKASYRGTIAR